MNTYFILSIVSLLSAVVIIALKVCYASKCENISICFGCLLIQREVELESRTFNSEEDSFKAEKLITRMNIEKNSLQEVPHLQRSYV